jgi:uncharacterized protein with ATP-grasp and redox domains
LKVGSRCGYCLLHRGYQEILRATDNESLRFEAIQGVLRILGENFDSDTVPSRLGSERDRLIRRVTETNDPYMDLKRKANAKALKVLPELEAIVETQLPGERLRVACKLACIGNVIEYDVPGHSHDIDEALRYVEVEPFYIDDTDMFRKFLRPNVEVMLLADNAGEIAFDRLIVQELHALGCRVTVVLKGGPSLNDALIEDAEAVGMHEEADTIITTGTDAIGVNLSDSSEEFKKAYSAADIIVAKGMANWETLTEYQAPCPILFLLRTKCRPVAASVGAPLHKNIAKLVQEGWRL